MLSSLRDTAASQLQLVKAEILERAAATRRWEEAQQHADQLSPQAAVEMARIWYRVWYNGVRRNCAEPTAEAYRLALAYPENYNNAQLWYEAGEVYISYQAFEGASALLEELLIDGGQFQGREHVHLLAAWAASSQQQLEKAAEHFL